MFKFEEIHRKLNDYTKEDIFLLAVRGATHISIESDSLPDSDDELFAKLSELGLIEECKLPASKYITHQVMFPFWVGCMFYDKCCLLSQTCRYDALTIVNAVGKPIHKTNTDEQMNNTDYGR